VKTERLELIAATPELLRAELEGKLAEALDVTVGEWPPPLNDEETVRYTLRFLEADRAHAGWMSWYFLKAEGRILIGQGGYGGLPKGGVVEIGYSLVPAHQKQGYATEAVRALIDRARGLGVHTVTAQTLPSLTASIRLLERLGFEPAGAGDEEGSLRYRLMVR
jgi:RimJ/RimL family protein N-acetyltransferase